MTDPIVLKQLNPSPKGSQAVQGPKRGAEVSNNDKLRQACRDFESILTQQMMQQMRQTVPENSLFSGGRAEEIYTSMMDGEMAKTFAQGRGLGLSEVMYRQLSALQDKAEGKD
jgi:flagellar protein FlgJ